MVQNHRCGKFGHNQKKQSFGSRGLVRPEAGQFSYKVCSEPDNIYKIRPMNLRLTEYFFRDLISAGLTLAAAPIKRAAPTERGRTSSLPGTSRCISLMLTLAILGMLGAGRTMAGTWTALTNIAPDNIDTMLLLSDGTVMAASGEPNSGHIGNAWYRLTPDTNGSYVNGTWSTIAPMQYTRLYYASQVLTNGRVLIAGGEYGTGWGTSEIYDPVAGTWTQVPVPAGLLNMNNQVAFSGENGAGFMDAGSQILPNGNVLVAPVFPANFGGTMIYNAASNSWGLGPTTIRGFDEDEATLLKLPDDSILTIDAFTTKSERYIPALNEWVNDANVPVPMYDIMGELGGAFVLPNGQAFFIGATGNTAIYTPSRATTPGSWAAGAVMPNGLGAPDAPSAMMVNGKILCAFGPVNTFDPPTTFCEYDSVANTFTIVSGPTGPTFDSPPYPMRMLDLPDGTVLLSTSAQQLYSYQPDGSPLLTGKPTISSIIQNSDGSYHLTGTLLNGISQGASYGDDAQMNSNYPLVRMTNSAGKVFYARTHGWSSTGILTGNKSVSTEFTVPANLPLANYSLVVVANGVSSDPVSFLPISLPVLEVSTNIISGGNGNGIIDNNECNALSLILTNAGSTNATSVFATLSTTTPGVIIVQPNSTYPDMASGGTGTNLTAFKISTSPVFVCGTPVDMTLVLKSAQVTTTNQFTISSGALGTPVRFDNSSALIVPDNNLAGTSSTILVSNITSVLMNVTVSLNILQPDVGDLTVNLIGPDGTTVLLSQQNGGVYSNYGLDCNSDGDRTTFDDSATELIDLGSAPFTGTFQPDSPLAVFAGKSGNAVNGAWQLQVIDPFSDSFGAIQCWSLILTPAGCTDGGGQCPGVDLALGMTEGPNPVILGNTLTYSMTITNNGPNTATGVALSQTLPGNVQIVSASTSQGLISTNSGGTVTCNLGNLLVGGTATVTVVVFPVSAGTIFSTATVGSKEDDFNLANNTATVGTVVQSPTADIAVGLAANPSPILVGGIFNYTVSVSNNGPSTATGVVVTNTLPPNISLISANSSQGTCSSINNLITCALGTLLKGSNATITIQARALNVGTITATATASANQIDPAPTNNTASVTSTVTPAADISLIMSGPPSVIIGSNATYQLTVQNLGPSPATGINVQDTLPPGVTFVSVANLPGTSSVSNGILGCALTNSLAAGASVTFSITINTAPLSGVAPLTIVNVGTAAANQADPFVANNNASVSTYVDYPRVNVVANGATLLGEAGPPTNGMINPGQTVTVSFSLQNIGNINATNVSATLLGTGGVVTNSPQTKSYGLLTPAGSASNPFTFTANATNGATITATLQLSGGATNQVKFSFVLPNTNSFANANSIIIPDHGPATNGFPSQIIVSGLTGLVGKVTVTLTNVNHTYPDDVDMLLVGPGGQNVLLESHAGGGGVLTNVSLTFDDYATNSLGARNFLPASSQILSGTYAPSQFGAVNFTNNFGGTIQLPQTNLPPAQPYGTNLAIFNGTNPNGTWKLYVVDSSASDQGIIVGGWSLAIESGNPINPVVDLAMAGTAVPNPNVSGGSVTYTFSITNNGPATATSIAFTNTLPGNVSFVSATNSALAVSTTNGSGAVYCIFTNLAMGANVSVTVVVSPTAVGTITSQATVAVTGGGSDPNQSNNSATVVVTNAPVADVSVAMSVLPNPGLVGNNLSYAISVTNNGPGIAYNVAVTDPLGGLGYALGLPAFTISNGAAFLNLPNLAPGTGTTVLLSLTPTVAGTITNIVSVTTASSDANPANNSASVVTTVSNAAPNIVGAGLKLISGNGPANGSVNPGEQVTVSFALANNGSMGTANLMATLLPGNGIASPSEPQPYGALSSGAAPVSRQFSFTGSGINGGIITAMLQLQDGAANLGTVTFYFNLPATNTFANGALIMIPDHGPATPYPSTILVSGVTGVVSRLTVTLTNLSHQFPNDVEALLAGPAGQTTVLMSGTGGPFSVNNLMLTFDDAAAGSLPASPGGPIVSGTFKPTDDGLAPVSLTPAPAPPYNATLSAFNGTNPNGTWALYVFDNSSGDGGSIAGGWSLNLETVNPVNAIANQNPPILTATPANIDGAFTLTLTGQVGQLYVILASTDLKTWTPVSTNATSVNGVLTFADTNSVNFPRRYYRASLVPNP